MLSSWTTHVVSCWERSVSDACFYEDRTGCGLEFTLHTGTP